MPEGAEEGILAGMYPLRKVEAEKPGLRLRLLGSGAILREVEAAAELLAKDFGVSSEIWSVTSFTELRRDGLEVERWNMLHPEAPPRISYVEQVPRQGRRAGDRGDRLHQGDRRTASGPSSRRATRCWAPTASADPTIGAGLRSFFEVDRYHVARGGD